MSAVRRTPYQLRDASGTHVATHVRYDDADGKRMVWELPSGEAGLGGIATADLPLYGIDRLGKDATVVVVEGEKAADTLIRVGVQAVGTVTGASSTPGQAALAELGGRHVVLWPDNDDVGRAGPTPPSTATPPTTRATRGTLSTRLPPARTTTFTQRARSASTPRASSRP